MVKLIIEHLPTWSPAFAVFQLLLATYKIYIVWFLAKVFCSVVCSKSVGVVACRDIIGDATEPSQLRRWHQSARWANSEIRTWRSFRGLDGHDGLWPVTWGLWSGPYLPHGSTLPAVSFSGMYFRRQSPPTTLPMGLEPQYLGILSIALLEVT